MRFKPRPGSSSDDIAEATGKTNKIFAYVPYVEGSGLDAIDWVISGENGIELIGITDDEGPSADGNICDAGYFSPVSPTTDRKLS